MVSSEIALATTHAEQVAAGVSSDVLEPTLFSSANVPLMVGGVVVASRSIAAANSGGNGTGGVFPSPQPLRQTRAATRPVHKWICSVKGVIII